MSEVGGALGRGGGCGQAESGLCLETAGSTSAWLRVANKMPGAAVRPSGRGPGPA